MTDVPFRLPPELASCEDLSHLTRGAARDGEYPFDLDPQYAKLFADLARAFHRSQARHVVLVGERGVGHGTIITELARRVTVGQIPFLANNRIVAIDCRYVPCEESRERLTAILAHVAQRSEIIACFDGFANLMRSDRGRSNKGLLLAALARSSFRMLGRLTSAEYEELVADDADMLEFFQRVDIAEPSLDTAQKLLRHFAVGLQQKYRVAIDADAVDRAVVLSANYILNERLPGKAVRILHRVCEDIDYERTQLGAKRDRVTVDDIIAVVAQTSGVPPETLRGIAEKSDYAKSLGAMVIGQESAVREVATELSLIKAGLTDRNKPASVMLFVGQTGTGKTEMAKALARFYSTSKRLRIYTLGNFVEPHSVAGLIGVPAGYVGHDQGGRLINELNSDPYCVFLLDEADKAHPDVLQPFLNLFDEGWVRDQRGVQAHADKAIFILTTNVGQRMILDMAKQGKSAEEIADRMKEALAQIRHGKSNRPVFAPEFVARIKRVVVFKPLDRAAMDGICRKLVREMQRNWLETRRQALEVSDALIDLIAERSHARNEKSDGREGGRIVRKLISELIDTPLQRESTERTDEYRAAETVAVDLHSKNGQETLLDPGAPLTSPVPPDQSVVRVRFVPADNS
jgi:ATP-dependent Clp protease ATP-binding subunit ClpC